MIEPLPSGQATRRWSDLLQKAIDQIESSSLQRPIETELSERTGRQDQQQESGQGDWREAIAGWSQEPSDSVGRWARRWSSHPPVQPEVVPPAATQSSTGDSLSSTRPIAQEMARSWLAAGGPTPLGRIWCKVAEEGDLSVPLLRSEVAWLKLLSEVQDRRAARPWRLSLWMVAAIWMVAIFLIEYHGGILHSIAQREHLEDQAIPVAMERVRHAVPIVAPCLLALFALLWWLWRRWLAGRQQQAWRTHAQWLFAQQLLEQHFSVPEAIATARRWIAPPRDPPTESDPGSLPTDSMGLRHAVRWSEIQLRYQRDRWQAAGYAIAWMLGLLGIATAIAAASLPWIVMIRAVTGQFFPEFDAGSIPIGGER